MFTSCSRAGTNKTNRSDTFFDCSHDFTIGRWSTNPTIWKDPVKSSLECGPRRRWSAWRRALVLFRFRKFSCVHRQMRSTYSWRKVAAPSKDTYTCSPYTCCYRLTHVTPYFSSQSWSWSIRFCFVETRQELLNVNSFHGRKKRRGATAALTCPFIRLKQPLIGTMNSQLLQKYFNLSFNDQTNFFWGMIWNIMKDEAVPVPDLFK